MLFSVLCFYLPVGTMRHIIVIFGFVPGLSNSPVC